MANTHSFENKGTSSDAAVTVIAATTKSKFQGIRIINTGSQAGFVTFNDDEDGNTIWRYISATQREVKWETPNGVLINNHVVQIKRVAGSSDMSGVYGDMW